MKGAVIARRASDGETVLALNEKEYQLDGDDDGDRRRTAGPRHRRDHGRRAFGVSATTTDTLLEIAYFTPEQIARTGQKLQLTSDARSRFERGVDPAFLDDGLAILTGLILDICGGEASRGLRAGEPPVEDKRVRFDPGQDGALGGMDVPAARATAILERLGFEGRG